jgi:hypothetical protein
MDRSTGPGRQLVESFYAAELLQPLLRRYHRNARAVIGREICDTDGQLERIVRRLSSRIKWRSGFDNFPDAQPRVKSSKNSKANRIETGERSGGIGEICSVEVDEK